MGGVALCAVGARECVGVARVLQFPRPPLRSLRRPHIKDMGLEARVEEGEEMLKEVSASIPECVHRVNGKVASSRWFWMFGSLEQFMPLWTRRLVVLMLMGLGLGLLKCDRSSVLAALEVARVQEGGDIPKASTKSEPLDIAAVRKSRKHTLQFCYLNHADNDFYHLVKGLTLLAKLARGEFQRQRKLVRSTGEACQAYTQWAVVHGRKALAEMVAVLHGGTLAQELDMRSRVRNCPLAMVKVGEIDQAHPLVVMEDMLSGR